jgi:ribosomal protein S18 acetylase RimI-like enzyme
MSYLWLLADKSIQAKTNRYALFFDLFRHWAAMTLPIIEFNDDSHAELDAFLVDQIYQFNAKATGFDDGEVLAASIRDSTGEVIAAVTGHTWGGTCYIAHLWVHESHRRDGLGKALMAAVESEAISRACAQVLLATHSFQAPTFYERLGYEQQASIHDYPRGCSQLHYVKRLAANGA